MILDLHVNLNTGGLSAKHTSGKRYGRLYAHAQTAVIKKAVMRVQKGGHARAVAQKTRNVHAFVRGEAELDANISNLLSSGEFRLARYNPFIADYFFDAETRQPIEAADTVVLDRHRMYVKNARK